MTKRPERLAEKGYSLPELLIVVAILGVLATFAVFSINKPKAHFQRQNAARLFKASLERARADSIKRRAVETDEMARVIIENANTFALLLDLNADGVLTANEIRRFPLPASSKIAGKNFVFPVRITFNFRGHVAAFNADNLAVTPLFAVCDTNCSQAESGSSENYTMVSISPTGTTVYSENASPLMSGSPQTPVKIDANVKIDPKGIVYN